MISFSVALVYITAILKMSDKNTKQTIDVSIFILTGIFDLILFAIIARIIILLFT